VPHCADQDWASRTQHAICKSNINQWIGDEACACQEFENVAPPRTPETGTLDRGRCSLWLETGRRTEGGGQRTEDWRKNGDREYEYEHEYEYEQDSRGRGSLVALVGRRAGIRTEGGSGSEVQSCRRQLEQTSGREQSSLWVGALSPIFSGAAPPRWDWD
jgi:hypothetical protein